MPGCGDIGSEIIASYAISRINRSLSWSLRSDVDDRFTREAPEFPDPPVDSNLCRLIQRDLSWFCRRILLPHSGISHLILRISRSSTHVPQSKKGYDHQIIPLFVSNTTRLVRPGLPVWRCVGFRPEWSSWTHELSFCDLTGQGEYVVQMSICHGCPSSTCKSLLH